MSDSILHAVNGIQISGHGTSQLGLGALRASLSRTWGSWGSPAPKSGRSGRGSPPRPDPRDRKFRTFGQKHTSSRCGIRAWSRLSRRLPWMSAVSQQPQPSLLSTTSQILHAYLSPTSPIARVMVRFVPFLDSSSRGCASGRAPEL
jgi:hypothetical protein